MNDALENIQMSYEGLVEAGREARRQVDNVQWIEGDLALQVEALPGDERPRDPETGEFIVDEKKALRRYADDVDVAYSTIQEYRRVADAWPFPTRVGEVSWKTHQVLAAQDDRFELIQPGMSVRRAQKLIRHRLAGASGKPGWFELLGEVADTLLRADKQLAKLESELRRKPNQAFRDKAGEYAGIAESIAQGLRKIEEAA